MQEADIRRQGFPGGNFLCQKDLHRLDVMAQGAFNVLDGVNAVLVIRDASHKAGVIVIQLGQFRQQAAEMAEPLNLHL